MDDYKKERLVRWIMILIVALITLYMSLQIRLAYLEAKANEPICIEKATMCEVEKLVCGKGCWIMYQQVNCPEPHDREREVCIKWGARE